MFTSIMRYRSARTVCISASVTGSLQAGDMLLQGRRKLLFADFGDVLLLERQALAQGVPRDGILADVVQRTEHVPGVLQRIIVVGQDGARSARKLADIADRLDAEQQDHGEQHANAQGKPPCIFIVMT